MSRGKLLCLCPYTGVACQTMGHQKSVHIYDLMKHCCSSQLKHKFPYFWLSITMSDGTNNGTQMRINNINEQVFLTVNIWDDMIAYVNQSLRWTLTIWYCKRIDPCKFADAKNWLNRFFDSYEYWEASPNLIHGSCGSWLTFAHRVFVTVLPFKFGGAFLAERGNSRWRTKSKEQTSSLKNKWKYAFRR